jgi:hypothetical protein
MKIKLSELRKIVRSVINEEPATMRSQGVSGVRSKVPDTELETSPDTMHDPDAVPSTQWAGPDTERRPGHGPSPVSGKPLSNDWNGPDTDVFPKTLASPGAHDSHDDTSLESFLDDMDQQDSPTEPAPMTMRSLGLGRQGPDTELEISPRTVRSPR